MGIKAKFGECVECNDGKEVLLYRRNPPECKYHYNIGKSKIYRERALEKEKQQGKPKKKAIKNISSKELKRLAKYRPIRDKYMAENKVCEVDGCFKASTNLHHRAGRLGDLIWMKEYFMACCGNCHPWRIHHHPDYEGWAREKGYIITVNLK